ncbi:MAG TPA: Holliday junction branch migration protein RuvA [Solirubrobacteraceae bacterium]|nr:Holliday junction branch migration protein RuvA [Solirubrobacteraceae bacterium]
MIALLQGEVAVRRPDHVVLVAGSVGYRAAVSAHTLAHVPAVGERVTLHTHLIAREDALTLYGFHSEQERELFLMLLSVQAVGPKVALAVLSGGAPRELLAALAAGDAARLQAVPGIGKRTAERIIVELREKVAASTDLPAGVRTPILAHRGGGSAPEPRALAREGLLELGYAPAEAEEMLGGVEGDTAEELIAGALRMARAGA